MVDSIGVLCCGCSLCANICPKKSITMKMNSEGFYYPSIDHNSCIKCGLCKKSCPILNKIEIENDNSCFVVRSKDVNILNSSASGGFFTPIAEYFIDNNGSVCAAGFDPKWNIRHFVTSDKKMLSNLRSSKYVQSDLADSYHAIEAALIDGNKVLFCGTPCQVQAIKQYVRKLKLKDNLYTIDLVCKGVGSPGIWRNYLSFQEKRYNSKIVYINFREKINGYHSSNMLVRFANGKKSSRSKTDMYIKAYVNEYLTRPSCYHCKFKGVDRCSDFTIFDSWHMQQLVKNNKDDDNGYTCVITHNERAKKVLESLKEKYDIYNVDLTHAINLDGIMVNNLPKANKLRNNYIKNSMESGIDIATRNCHVITIKDVTIELLKKILHSVGLLNQAKKMFNR